MGKRAKAHRAKVAKRNRRLSQQRYSAQNALTKMMEEMAKAQDSENLNVNVGDKEMPFEFVAEPESSGIKGFEVSDEPVVKHDGMTYNPENPIETLKVDEVEPEFDSAGFSIEDREIDIDIDMSGEFAKVKDSND